MSAGERRQQAGQWYEACRALVVRLRDLGHYNVAVQGETVENAAFDLTRRSGASPSIVEFTAVWHQYQSFQQAARRALGGDLPDIAELEQEGIDMGHDSDHPEPGFESSDDESEEEGGLPPDEGGLPPDEPDEEPEEWDLGAAIAFLHALHGAIGEGDTVHLQYGDGSEVHVTLGPSGLANFGNYILKCIEHLENGEALDAYGDGDGESYPLGPEFGGSMFDFDRFPEQVILEDVPGHVKSYWSHPNYHGEAWHPGMLFPLAYDPDTVHRIGAWFPWLHVFTESRASKLDAAAVGGAAADPSKASRGGMGGVGGPSTTGRFRELRAFLKKLGIFAKDDVYPLSKPNDPPEPALEEGGRMCFIHSLVCYASEVLKKPFSVDEVARLKAGFVHAPGAFAGTKAQTGVALRDIPRILQAANLDKTVTVEVRYRIGVDDEDFAWSERKRRKPFREAVSAYRTKRYGVCDSKDELEDENKASQRRPRDAVSTSAKPFDAMKPFESYVYGAGATTGTDSLQGRHIIIGYAEHHFFPVLQSSFCAQGLLHCLDDPRALPFHNERSLNKQTGVYQYRYHACGKHAARPMRADILVHFLLKHKDRFLEPMPMEVTMKGLNAEMRVGEFIPAIDPARHVRPYERNDQADAADGREYFFSGDYECVHDAPGLMGRQVPYLLALHDWFQDDVVSTRFTWPCPASDGITEGSLLYKKMILDRYGNHLDSNGFYDLNKSPGFTVPQWKAYHRALQEGNAGMLAKLLPRTRVVLFFHNASYDVFCAFQDLKAAGFTVVKNGLCRKNFRIVSLKMEAPEPYRLTLTIKDSWRILNCSIKAIPKMFGFSQKEGEKELICHDWMTWDRVFDIPALLDFGGEDGSEEGIPSYCVTERELVSLSSLKGRADDFGHSVIKELFKSVFQKCPDALKAGDGGPKPDYLDLLKWAAFYCEQDARLLTRGLQGFDAALKELGSSLRSSASYSAASLADHFFTEQGCYEGVMEMNGILGTMFRAFVMGGRVALTNRREAPFCVQGEGNLTLIDVNSLYPSAMVWLSSQKGGYLKGTPKRMPLSDPVFSIIRTGADLQRVSKEKGWSGYFVAVRWVSGAGVQEDKQYGKNHSIGLYPLVKKSSTRRHKFGGFVGQGGQEASPDPKAEEDDPPEDCGDNGEAGLLHDADDFHHNGEGGVSRADTTRGGGFHWVTDVSREDVLYFSQVSFEGFLEFSGFPSEGFLVKWGFYFDEGRCPKVGETVSQLYELKRKASAEKNKGLASLVKLLLNSSYGRTIMGTTETEEKLLTGQTALGKALQKHYMRSLMYAPVTFEEDEGAGEKKSFILTLARGYHWSFSRPHIGAEILGAARYLMDRLINLSTDLNIELIYTDTDSFVLKEADAWRLSDVYAQRFGTELYGDGLGQVKEDLGDGVEKCDRGIFLGKKAYFLRTWRPSVLQDHGAEYQETQQSSDLEPEITYERATPKYALKGITREAILAKGRFLLGGKSKAEEWEAVEAVFEALLNGEKPLEFDLAEGHRVRFGRGAGASSRGLAMYRQPCLKRSVCF